VTPTTQGCGVYGGAHRTRMAAIASFSLAYLYPTTLAASTLPNNIILRNVEIFHPNFFFTYQNFVEEHIPSKRIFLFFLE
jgi:hypothetical protein